jgi:hypothetical protein
MGSGAAVRNRFEQGGLARSRLQAWWRANARSQPGRTVAPRLASARTTSRPMPELPPGGLVAVRRPRAPLAALRSPAARDPRPHASPPSRARASARRSDHAAVARPARLTPPPFPLSSPPPPLTRNDRELAGHRVGEGEEPQRAQRGRHPPRAARRRRRLWLVPCLFAGAGRAWVNSTASQPQAAAPQGAPGSFGSLRLALMRARPPRSV